MSQLLSRRLDPYLRPGAVDSLSLVRVLNEDIGVYGVCGSSEDAARRAALTAMAGAMIRYTGRRRTAAALNLRIGDAFRLAVLLGDLYEWVTDLYRADLDPDADMLRVRILQLHLEQSAGSVPAVGDLVDAAGALVRVSLAGTRPVS